MSRRDGYVVDVTYPLHFYKEMQPLWLNYVLNTLGCVTPDIGKQYSYCELGCGVGINLLVAAACNPQGHFVGVDFNHDHIIAAREIAQKAGIKNIEFIESSFDAFAKREHGRFDFIVSHGVWSWLPAEAKGALMQIVHESLNPQGIFYLQYMCYPGAARLIALQKMLHEVSLVSGVGSTESISQGMALLRKLADAGAGLFVDNPEIEKELTALEKEHPAYLAHDFLTHHWQPQHSSDVHRIISQAGVSYIGSANCLENMDALSVPGNLQPLLASAASRSLKEVIRDIARNQSQRVDIFQKEPRTFTSAEHLASLDRYTFKATDTMPTPGAVVFNTPIGKIPGPADLLTPLMSSLKLKEQQFADMRQLPVFRKEPGLLLQTLNLLMWAGYVHPLRAEGGDTGGAVGLQNWLSEQKIPLTLMPECGNAMIL